MYAAPGRRAPRVVALAARPRATWQAQHLQGVGPCGSPLWTTADLSSISRSPEQEPLSKPIKDLTLGGAPFKPLTTLKGPSLSPCYR